MAVIAVGVMLIASPAQAQQGTPTTPVLRLDGVEPNVIESLGEVPTIQECDATVPVGSQTPFASSVSNSGENPLSNTTLTLTVTSELQFVAGTEQADRGTWTVQNQQAVLNLGTLGGFETVNWGIEVLAVAPGTATFKERLECCGGAFNEATCTLTVEQAEVEPGSIGGIKWLDANDNGRQDSGEAGADGVVIFIDDNNSGTLDGGERSTTTSDGGFYTFTDLEPDTYTVREVVPEGSQQTFPANGAHVVELLPGENIEGINFGNLPSPDGAIHGYKFFDVDQDGIYDTEQGDRRLDGILIQLFDQAGRLVGEQITHSMDVNEDGFVDPFTEQGLFWFENLPLGVYRVVEVVPEGWERTFPIDNEDAHIVELTPDNLGPILIFGNFGPVLEEWGDLPDPLFLPVPSGCMFLFLNVCYNTVFPIGPTHLYSPFDPNPLRLGTHIDPEFDGQPDFVALGDDETPVGGMDDEDGVGTISYKGDGTGEVEITVNGPAGSAAFLDAWIDFDEDGLLEASEQIFVGVPVAVPSTATYRFPIPPGLGGGTFARFRISPVPFGLLPTGVVWGGEVEDYALLGVDYGDAREDNLEDFPDFPQGYPVVPASNGARHAISLQVRLGARVDHDGTGPEPSILASGDDKAFDDDEDGIDFTWGFFERTIELDATVPGPAAGQPFPFHALARGTTVELVPAPSVNGRLDAWVDFNRDGDWDDEGEQVFANEAIQPISGAPTDTLRFDVPAEADLGYTYARFRFSRNGNLNPTGAAPDGEVEDYLLQILSATTNLQIINAVVPGGTLAGKQDATFDLYLDGVRVVDDLLPGTATGFLPILLPATTATLDLTASDAADNGDPQFSNTLNLENEEATVAPANALILTGLEDGTLEVVLKKDVRQAAVDAASVEFFIAHAAPDEPALDVRLFDDAGTLLADNLAYGAATDYQRLDPAVYHIEVLTADTGMQVEVFRLDLSESAGTTLALLLTGQRSDDSFALTAFDAESNRIDPDVVTAMQEAGAVPTAFALHANYPNPFNPETTIRFDVAEAAQVRLAIFDALGRMVATLVDEELAPGSHQALFDGENLPSGTYFYRLEAGAFSQTKPMVLLK